MITALKTNATLDPGATDNLIQPGTWNDPADVATGMTIISGSYAYPQGVGGGIIHLNLTTVTGPNAVTLIEVQTIIGGTAKTLLSFVVNLTVAGVYSFAIRPGATDQGSYDGRMQSQMPNSGRIKITMTNRTNVIAGDLRLEHCW
jgi:hypothetical protein